MLWFFLIILDCLRPEHEMILYSILSEFRFDSPINI